MPVDADTTPTPSTVKVLHKASQLLDSFTVDEPDLTLTELAGKCGLHPATASRILATLEQLGFVARSSRNRTYRLGIKVFELGNRVRHQTELVRFARPHMDRLVQRFDESVYLSTYHDGSVVYLDIRESSNPIRLQIRVGDRAPVCSSASGQVLLAFLRNVDMRERIEADTPGLAEELQLIGQRGFLACSGLPHPEIASVAAPIFGLDRTVIAALALCGPVHRLSHTLLLELAPEVTKAANAISDDLMMRGNVAPVASQVPETARGGRNT